MNGVGRGSSRWSVVYANVVRSGFRGHDARSLVYVAVGFRTDGLFHVEQSERCNTRGQLCWGCYAWG